MVALVGWLVALLFPYAVESVLHEPRADAACGATVLSVWLAAGGGARRWVLAGLLAALACACDVAAAAWPVACAWAARGRGDAARGAWIVLFAGVVGAVAGFLAGWSWVTGNATSPALFAAHRDLTVLLPVVLLGCVGFARVAARAESPEFCVEGSAVRAWTWLCHGLLCLVVVGVPLNVRLCALPLVVWSSPALTELSAIIAGSGDAKAELRGVGILSGALVVGLTIPGLLRLADGPLMAVYLLSQ